MSNTANNKPAKKRKAPPAAWKPGQSGNPAGRPREGQSWAAIIKAVSEMTPQEVAQMVGPNTDLGRQFAMMPRGVQLKWLAVLRMYSSLMFEPSKGIWDGLVERDEGKVPDRVEATHKVEPDGFINLLAKVYGDDK